MVKKEQEKEKTIEIEEAEALTVQEVEQPKEAGVEAENNDYKDKYLRAMAEFENYRNRTISEKADWLRHATKELALKICDVLDNFERAIQNAKEEDLQSGFGQGIILIEKQLTDALAKEGVKKIEALGEEFDPQYHEALAHIPSEYDENKIAAIIKNGYTMHDKVIRAVQVAVSNGNISKEAQEE